MLIHGDSIVKLRKLKDESIDCCITSPPYWGLRDYGTAKWEGGDENCKHLPHNKPGPNAAVGNTLALQGRRPYSDICGKCGAIRKDNQLGLEKTPEEYTAKMVEVFSEVKRVLKNQGTLWLNLGDSYAGSCQGAGKNTKERVEGKKIENLGSSINYLQKYGHTLTSKPPTAKVEGLKPKDLVGIPWRIAFALQSTGWYLRQDIIWHKPNPMPESVTDRCTKAHEYIFLLTKSPKYYYDNEAIKEISKDVESHNGRRRRNEDEFTKTQNFNSYRKGFSKIKEGTKYETRNKRSVWTITTKPFKGAHFATFPEDLIRPCVLAGCPKGGTILDPFAGAGTVGVVAKRNNRNFIGIELNSKYLKMAENRINNTAKNLF